ncbi:MAG: LysR family transcriptional regulator [Bryobacteraceae bacterium]|nr:LysR family transcriptional regulator [Bryobacteraceae bacterium]
MNTTLDAWEVLYTVVQLGGFTRAAERLNRSQSTISYAVGRLQEQLGVQLFEIKGRKSYLTELGRALLADAEPHLAGFRELEKRACSLAAGGESEIRLSVDSIFPNERLFAALDEFTRRFPHVRPKLRQCAFLSADSEFSAHNTQLCVTGLMSHEFFVKPILEIQMVAVARRNHPLNARKRRLTRSEMMQHMLVIVEGLAAGSAKHQPRSPAQRFLAVGTIDAAIDAVRSGLCFGWLPRYRIRPDLQEGELVPLHMPAGQTREVRLSLVCNEMNSSSRELNALAELLGMNGGVETI